MCKIGQAVEMICVCDAGGKIRPIRFRLEEPDQSLLRVDIDEVVSTREIEYVGAESNIYLCRAVVHGRERLFELQYQIRSHCWQLLQPLY